MLPSLGQRMTEEGPGAETLCLKRMDDRKCQNLVPV
jgi:hypothetical protein